MLLLCLVCFDVFLCKIVLLALFFLCFYVFVGENSLAGLVAATGCCIIHWATPLHQANQVYSSAHHIYQSLLSTIFVLLFTGCTMCTRCTICTKQTRCTHLLIIYKLRCVAMIWVMKAALYLHLYCLYLYSSWNFWSNKQEFLKTLTVLLWSELWMLHYICICIVCFCIFIAVIILEAINRSFWRRWRCCYVIFVFVLFVFVFVFQ